MVVQDKGKTLWSGRVAKSCGVEGILAAAGLLVDHSVCRPSAMGRPPLIRSSVTRATWIHLPWAIKYSKCLAYLCSTEHG